MAGLIILNIIPIFQTIYQSFLKQGHLEEGYVFVGLDNYKRVICRYCGMAGSFKYIKVCCDRSTFSIRNCNRTCSNAEPENEGRSILQNDLLHAYGMCTGCSCHGVEMVI